MKTFHEILAEYKGTPKDFKEFIKTSNLRHALDNQGFFKELIENDIPDKEDLRYLFDKVENLNELDGLNDNLYLLQYIVENKIVSFQEVVDKYKNTRIEYNTESEFEDDKYSESCLDKLLENGEFFKRLITNNTLTKEDLRYLFDNIDESHELAEFANNFNLLQYTVNSYLLFYFVDNNIVSFQELVNKFKDVSEDYESQLFCSGLHHLLSDDKLYESDKLTREDLKYLMDKIDEDNELDVVCSNDSLIKRILSEFILNKNFIDNHDFISANIFQRIQAKNSDEEILKLAELNGYTYILNLTKEQSSELSEVLKDNEIALNRLKEVVDSKLESQFDFDSLMVYLKKEEKKTVLNI